MSNSSNNTFDRPLTRWDMRWMIFCHYTINVPSRFLRWFGEAVQALCERAASGYETRMEGITGSFNEAKWRQFNARSDIERRKGKHPDKEWSRIYWIFWK